MLGLAILALEGQTALGGDAGWVGAGLLGAVLAWLLLKHLPAKDAQIQTFMSMKDGQIERMQEIKNKQIELLVNASTTQQEMMHRENQAALNRVVQHCEEEMASVHNSVQKEVQQLTAAILLLKDQLLRANNQSPNQSPGRG